MKPRELNLPKLRAPANFEPTSANAEARTVELVWYTGSPVLRYNFWNDETYELAFSMEKSAVRMGRLESGAPLLNAHNNYQLDGAIGVVEKASIEKGRGMATVRFSSRAEVGPIWNDVTDGILRNVSMGAVVHQMKDVTQKGDRMKRLLAIDWEPMEVSLVPVGADPGAQVLSQQGERFPCIVQHTEETMTKVRLLETNEIVEIEESEFDEKLHSHQLTAPSAANGSDRSEEREVQDAIEADNKRATRIRELAMHYELDEVWAQRHIKLGSTAKQATADAIKKRAELAPQIDGRLPSITNDYDSLGWKGARMVEALHARITRTECPEPARQFERMSFAEVAFGVLQTLGKARGRMLDPLRNPADVIQLAMSTSDFPGLLANLLNKNLEAAYNQATPSFRAFSSRREFRDYRPHKFVRIGDFPVPLQVGENGEITQGAVGEGSETVTVLKYGRILAIGRETLINDDVAAFNDFGGMVARRIIDFENATFYTRCILAGAGLGPNLADGVAVYNVAHGNNVGAAGALSNTLLAEAFTRLASMTSIDGLKLNLPPRFILTPPGTYVLARTLLTSIYPAQASNVNPFAGMMEAIYDANLTGTRFYVLTDPGNGSNYVWGTIGGSPRYAVRDGWETEGVQVKVVHDFGCGPVDYRFGYTAAGA